MSELLNPDDAGDGYLVHRESTTSATTVQDFIRRMEAGQTEAKPPAGSTQPPTGEKGRSLPQRILGVAGDIGKGLGPELPRSLVGGVSDMVHNVFTAADHLGDWLNEHVADLRIPIPPTEDEVEEAVRNDQDALLLS